MAEPTAQEVLMWTLINRARLDPAGEAARDGISLNEGLAAGTISSTSKQPLAWNSSLFAAADQHSQDMITRNYFGHNDPVTGSTPQSRANAAGYVGTNNVGENIAWSGSTGAIDATQMIYDEEKMLFVDSNVSGRGHRLNIMDDRYQEVGVGQVIGTFQGYNASMITQDFGIPATATQFLTGVAYNDNNGNAFYDVGEGRGGVTVTTSAGSAQTGTAGAYSEAIGAGTQTITFSGGGLAANVSVSATIAAGRNALIDLVGQSTVETSVSLTALNGVTKIIGLGNTGLSLTGNTLDNVIVSAKGNDLLDGAGGTDTVVYSGNKASYTITTNANGTVTVSGAEGTDTLTSIEKLQFADQTVVLSGGSTGKPDLVVDSITAAASVVQGQKLDLSYLVKNLGTAAAGQHYAGINVDGAVDESHYTAWNTVNSLAANGQATFTNSIDTAGLGVGQHTLYIKEDYWYNGVDESNESNNVKSITFNVTAPVATQPDLVVDSITAAASVVQGQKLDFSYIVKDIGTAAAGLHYAGINVDGAVDESHYTGWNTVNSLAANGQATFTNSIDTTSLSVGQHTLYVKEDYWHNGVSESNESNNVKSITFNVTAPVVTQPDLVVDSITAAASVTQGQKLDVSYLVKNLGTAAAGQHYAGINVDGAVDESHYTAWNTVSSVAANGQATFTNSIDTAGLSVGQHTLYIKEDYWYNGVSESNESNNVKSFIFNVTAPAKPDLVVSSISAPASVEQGDSFDFSFLVKNLGSTAAGQHYAGINVDGAVDESHYMAWNTVNSLAANGQATFTNSIDTDGLSVGQHTLYIKDDYWYNGVAESNESNNVTAVTFNVTANTANHAPEVTTYDQTLGTNEWAQAYWFIDYSDPDGDAITQFRFWDGGTAATSGYFWTPDNPHQPAGTAITVDAAHLEDVWFRGGQTAGTEQLWVQASDGHNWSQWMSMNVTTELH